jgi:hypothetical protein
MIHDLLWATNGPNGVEPLQFKRLGDLTTEHLNNILMCCGFHIPYHYRVAIVAIIIERDEIPIVDTTLEESNRIYDAYITRRNILLRNGVK